MRVLLHPNPALKQQALAVDPRSDRQLARLVKQMGTLMYAAPGIGLAAPQLGVQKRLIVFDVEDAGEPTALCNPVIVETSELTCTEDEGCLSLPGVVVPVERHVGVVCEAESLTGEKVRIEADDILARVLQHEIDHLDGILVIDRASPEERKAAIRSYFEYQRAEKL